MGVICLGKLPISMKRERGGGGGGFEGTKSVDIKVFWLCWIIGAQKFGGKRLVGDTTPLFSCRRLTNF